ncbi:MAG: LytTR family DNA-binding domain-containing protein [Lachnospiraceae bacterium]|nr:LytTR family DNA-binding domain-containing protein [Lachnospiraceae bacterium]
MYKIFLCEDNPIHLERFQKMIRKYIFSKPFEIEMALFTDSSEKLLTYVKANPNLSGLYFLDVDLQEDINGIELAAQIKEYDISSTIVFITTQSELAYLTFHFRVEAMDYITKDHTNEEIEKRIIECIDLSYERFLKGKHHHIKYFPIKVEDRILNVPYNDILFFEVYPDPKVTHRLILYTDTQTLHFRGQLKNVLALGPEFFNCHKSIVVNLNKIKHVDKKKREVVLYNGDIVPVSKRKVYELVDVLEKRGNR